MMLKVENVSVHLGKRQVLQGVSFHVPAGQSVAIMGPNGAGKTTLLRCILGLIRYHGRILVDGIDAERNGIAARSKIAYVPQVPANFDLTARELLVFVARLRGVSRGEVDRALERMGLAADAHRPISVFSGGMMQRLYLAAALLGDSPLVLLDEPTANLDSSTRVSVLALLSEVRASGKTLILSSHRPREIRGLADRVVLLEEGRIVREGSPEEVLPVERLCLSVKARDRASLAKLLLSHGATPLPSCNGTFHALVPAKAAVLVVNELRRSGYTEEQISLGPAEDGAVP